MKNLVNKGMVFTILIIVIAACKKSIVNRNPIGPAVNNSELGNSSNNTKQAEEPPKIKVKLKHTEEYVLGQPMPEPCAAPFWICVMFSSRSMNMGETISINERQENIASIELKLIDVNHIKLTPDALMTDNSNVFKMTDNMELDPITCSKFGLDKMILKKGTYYLNPGDGDFGSVIVEIIK